MKAVILAGGLGTRLSEETGTKPKPMVEIGGKPILWHIMKSYSAHGINDFIICCGYKGYMIKEYFHNYLLHQSDITIDIKKNQVQFHQSYSEPWTITLVDTGEETMTGGRLKRVRKYIGDENFCFTYGDGVSDINITNLIKYHESHQKLATVSAVRPPGRFGVLVLDKEKNNVINFSEKSQGDSNWINAGFFVLHPSVIETIKDDSSVWETGPLVELTQKNQLVAYKHEGFWHAMDTLREKKILEDLWASGKAPWKTWQ